MNKIAKISKFINDESMYMLMLAFIIFFNAFIIFSNSIVFSSHLMPESVRTESHREDEVLLEEKLLKKVMEENKPIAATIGIAYVLGVGALVAGIALSIKFIILKFRGAFLIPPTIEQMAINWSVWDVCRAGILFLFFGYIIHIIEAALSSPPISVHLDEHLRMILSTVLMDGICLVLVIYFVVVKYGQKIKALGFTLKRCLSNILLGLTGYVTILPTLVGILAVILWITRYLDYHPPSQPVFALFLKEDRPFFLIFSASLVIGLGPIAEEVFFRGFMYSALKNKLGIKGAIFLSSVFFASLHTSVVGFLPIMVLGALLAYLYEKTGSLVPSITVHILHNSLLVLLLFLTKAIIQVGT